MKKIEAIIRKSRFEDVKKALLAADIEWFSYYNVRGEGKMRQARIYRGVMYDTSSIERVLLNIVVRDKNVEPTIAAITGCSTDRRNRRWSYLRDSSTRYGKNQNRRTRRHRIRIMLRKRNNLKC